MHGDNEPQVTQGTECAVKWSCNLGDDAVIMPTNGTLSPMPPENTPLTSSAMIIADSTTPTPADHLAKCTCLAKSTEKINKNMHNSVISNSLASQIGDRTLWEDNIVSLGSPFQEPLNKNVKVSPGALFDDMSIDNTYLAKGNIRCTASLKECRIATDTLLLWLGKMAKSLFIFLFFFFYLGLITQKGVWESVISQVSHSHSHMTGSHNIMSHNVTWWVTW